MLVVTLLLQGGGEAAALSRCGMLLEEKSLLKWQVCQKYMQGGLAKQHFSLCTQILRGGELVLVGKEM